MRELEYPYKSEYIISKKKQIEKELESRLKNSSNILNIKIAILAGSTINEFKNILNLFLLNNGIKADFYLSQYNKYYEEAVFENDELLEFNPDIVYVFTTCRNINHDFDAATDLTSIDEKLEFECNKFLSIWEGIKNKYNATIIQNNFEYPPYRLLGNKDISDKHGLSNFLKRLNDKFYEYCEKDKSFYICDINYISANYGLDKWHNERNYALYKLPCDLMAFVDIAFNVCNIIKSIYGKNKKALAIDLDNTIWGGVISEDGISNLKVGPETAEGEIYLNFQKYLKKFKSLGVLLNVVSKNDEEVAIDGIKNTDGVLEVDDFVDIKANWEPKSDNIIEISKKLNIGSDAFAFIDDNPMERDLVRTGVKGIGILNVDSPETYIKTLDKSGFIETTNITKEDIEKIESYKQNIKRDEYKNQFINYNEYLKSLNMKAVVSNFEKKYYDRISQLSNKSNQFNLTTKRYSLTDIEHISEDENYLALYGKLSDKFGDNGIVSLIIAKIENDVSHIELFLMSCRVLKRDMEYKMLDEFVNRCKEIKVNKIVGNYIKTDKNKMVKNLYADFGFIKVSEDANENSKWELCGINNYKPKCDVIELIGEGKLYD